MLKLPFQENKTYKEDDVQELTKQLSTSSMNDLTPVIADPDDKPIAGGEILQLMGGKIPDTTAMKRGRILEDEVRKNSGSPDGICENSIIEIKCPMSQKTVKTYVNNGKPTQKFYVQMQLQMLLTGHKKGYFCVADCNYSANKKVDIMEIMYDENMYQIFLRLALWYSGYHATLVTRVQSQPGQDGK
ncbi:hypothetical protein EVAR_89394_1 [Eumeta japonica]|uniref:YqaJ viral recombinase domain-containing protein n=1 Tax=Eumeta variegata TaxID=151549 RepID=A0A4C1XPY8_EUMVA|nr:hypothetical protein EVAR_89394_1 [Eumeta japonica]